MAHRNIHVALHHFFDYMERIRQADAKPGP
jgi:hypothetical protein